MATDNMSYAYYTTIFQDARRTENTRYTGPQPTYELIRPYTGTPLAPIPISRSPRSRPFMAFANSAPMPPPDWCRFYVSPEEREPEREVGAARGSERGGLAL
ncbi:hypothetical protein EKO27_g6520 [Xylaria grammica]|uniref:Uncharacterized protein n=1 Tax=Xylaria grammica TaxID=363999 RepID=A0A439D2B7_9PEZI|nr:hypothetical protein EKO27_g6520 [Xylaria grammica]